MSQKGIIKSVGYGISNGGYHEGIEDNEIITVDFNSRSSIASGILEVEVGMDGLGSNFTVNGNQNHPYDAEVLVKVYLYGSNTPIEFLYEKPAHIIDGSSPFQSICIGEGNSFDINTYGKAIEKIEFSTEGEGSWNLKYIDAKFTNTALSTPLILDLDNDGIETLSIEQGVRFDIDADGDKDKTGWVGSDDGLLVRDINKDGIINNASELFGEETKKEDGSKAKDGFEALKELDSNNDGLVNKYDELFSELKVWKDSNSDGITNEGELISLEKAGISEISLEKENSNIESNGNIIGLEGTYLDINGEEKDMADVWFAYEENLENEAIDLTTNIINSNIDLINNKEDIVNVKFEEIIDLTDDDNELIILGEGNDKIVLEGGIKSEDNEDGKWESTGKKEDSDGAVYNTYQSAEANAIVRILIDDDIDINNI